MTTDATDTRCGPASLCAHPAWQITHGRDCGPYCCNSVDRDLFCYTCGASWTDCVSIGQIMDGDEPPFSYAPDVCDLCDDDATNDATGVTL